MNVFILDKNFDIVQVVDNYISFIWTDRYWAYGDFELFVPTSSDLLTNAVIGNYIYFKKTEHSKKDFISLMIIEEHTITTDPEEGSRLLIKGRSLESLLSRRIIWGQAQLNGCIQFCIQFLINLTIIAPVDENRKIENFTFSENEDERLSNILIDTQFTGDNLYTSINLLCSANGIGFNIRVTEDKKFAFQIYLGDDHSYEQSELPYIVFSPQYENLANSKYYKSNAAYKNVALIAGEGEGTARKMVSLYSNDFSGIDRRELFVDARDVSTNNEEMTTDEYDTLLKNKGIKSLADDSNSIITTFEGEINNSYPFVFGKDFLLGDVVQIENEYGLKSRVRITEVVYSYDENGESVITTYVSL